MGQIKSRLLPLKSLLVPKFRNMVYKDKTTITSVLKVGERGHISEGFGEAW